MRLMLIAMWANIDKRCVVGVVVGAAECVQKYIYVYLRAGLGSEHSMHTYTHTQAFRTKYIS